jgi:hypothetical protein
VSDTIGKILEREPDWSALPAATPVAIRRLLRRCLEKDPKQRLQAIGEARIALSPPLIDEGTPVAARSPSGLALLAWALAGTFLLTTLTISFLHFRESRHNQHPLSGECS